MSAGGAARRAGAFRAPPVPAAGARFDGFAGVADDGGRARFPVGAFVSPSASTSLRRTRFGAFFAAVESLRTLDDVRPAFFVVAISRASPWPARAAVLPRPPVEARASGPGRPS
ncbi:MAG TPA: hypothetical protein VIG54_04305, partial [Lysobacter sp.]